MERKFNSLITEREFFPNILKLLAIYYRSGKLPLSATLPRVSFAPHFLNTGNFVGNKHSDEHFPLNFPSDIADIRV